MLKAHARGRHISFHTPGHKAGKWDITELVYSDNLSAPRGCIAAAEKDIAEILGAARSFILTDGSTSGVFSMLYAAKRKGVKRVLVGENSHSSVFNACATLGLTPLAFRQKKNEGIPLPIRAEDIFTGETIEKAEALLLTCPDYYGNIAELSAIAARCREEKKLLLVDGAHGGHLHFDQEIYAGAYADLWVDGVHKSLPALTQGAIVSAREDGLSEVLYEGVRVFRTTSPSYPIMASVEYAVKYPRGVALERKAQAFAREWRDRVYQNGDWTKLCALFGENAFEVEKYLQKKGVYPEFCDGNAIVFYLSPATTMREWKTLSHLLSAFFVKYPYTPQKEVEAIPAPLVFEKNAEKEWVDLDESAGRICAADCGLFPPCTPLLKTGERVSAEKLALLKKADNVYGIYEDKILVYIGDGR